jgi:hypothetical protein
MLFVGVNVTRMSASITRVSKPPDASSDSLFYLQTAAASGRLLKKFWTSAPRSRAVTSASR